MGRMHTHQTSIAEDALAELKSEAAQHERLSEESLIDVPNRLQAEMDHERQENRAYQQRELARRYEGGICSSSLDVWRSRGDHSLGTAQRSTSGAHGTDATQMHMFGKLRSYPLNVTDRGKPSTTVAVPVSIVPDDVSAIPGAQSQDGFQMHTV